MTNSTIPPDDGAPMTDENSSALADRLAREWLISWDSEADPDSCYVVVIPDFANLECLPRELAERIVDDHNASRHTHSTDAEMVLHPLSDIRDLDEVVHELGIQDSDETPAEAVRKLNEEIESLQLRLAAIPAGSPGREEIIDVLIAKYCPGIRIEQQDREWYGGIVDLVLSLSPTAPNASGQPRKEFDPRDAGFTLEDTGRICALDDSDCIHPKCECSKYMSAPNALPPAPGGEVNPLTKAEIETAAQAIDAFWSQDNETRGYPFEDTEAAYKRHCRDTAKAALTTFVLNRAALNKGAV